MQEINVKMVLTYRDSVGLNEYKFVFDHHEEYEDEQYRFINTDSMQTLHLNGKHVLDIFIEPLRHD